MHVYKICICFLILINIASADFKYRKDTFFDKTIEKHWDKGFFVQSALGIDPFIVDKLLQGFTFGYTTRKRVKKESFGIILNFQGQFLRSSSFSPYVSYQHSLLAPLNLNILLYKNYGKYIKGLGSFLPFFGIGGGATTGHITISGATTQNSGLKANIIFGSEYLIYPPAFGLRFSLNAHALYTKNLPLTSYVGGGGTSTLSYLITFTIGLVSYVK